MKRTLTIFGGIAVLNLSQAAVISWGAATDTTSAADVSVNGTSLSALNGGASNVTVNGVSFTGSDLLAGSPVGVGLLGGGTTGDTGFNSLLDEVDFGGGTGVSVIDLGAFTSGNTIEIQVFFTDQRSAQQDRVMRYGSSTGGGTVDLEASPNNANTAPFGQYAIGTFVADGTDPDLTLAPQGFGNAHFTAIQVRDLGVIPEPSSLMLSLVACVGLLRRKR
ncbi:MAG: PEP-CTERM sorting domain-containing protein [Akkermansiaceae bacterium]